MKSADVSSMRMLRLATDRIDRHYADRVDIPAVAAGAKAIRRDDSGNWYSFTQHKFLEGKP